MAISRFPMRCTLAPVICHLLARHRLLHTHLVDITQFSPHETLANPDEAGRDVGHEVMVITFFRRGAEHPSAPKDVGNGGGRLLSGIDQPYPCPHHLGDYLFQQRIMGTAEHQSIGLLFPQTSQVCPAGKSRHLVVNPPLLDKGDEEWASLGYYLH